MVMAAIGIGAELNIANFIVFELVDNEVVFGGVKYPVEFVVGIST